MKNINEQIEKLQTELDELKAIANKHKEMIDRVQAGDTYYYINANYEVIEDYERCVTCDNKRYNIGNYYTDKSLAERVAKYYRDNNMYIRKAIEFANGYEFTNGEYNYWVEVEVTNNSYYIDYIMRYKVPNVIYMTKQSAEKFKAWLDEFMPLG